MPTEPLTATPATAAAARSYRNHFVRCLTYYGLWMIRRLRWLKRRLFAIGALLAYLLRSAVRRVRRAFIIFAVRNGLDHTKTTGRLRELNEERRSARENGPLAFAWFWCRQFLRGIWNCLRRICTSPSYFMPILALAAFLFVIRYTLGDTFALHVEYNGNDLGYIADESVYEKAELQMRGRIAYEDYIRPADAVPHYTIASVSSDQLLDVNTLTDELIRASGNELGEATGLYVDGEFLGAASDGKELSKMLDSLLAPYRSRQAEDEIVEFVKDVDLVEGLYPLTSIRELWQLERRVTGQQQKERIYTAVSGDAPSIIAEKNGISLSTLRALNPGIDDSLLVGQEVLVQQSVPYLEVQITRTEVYEEETPFQIIRTVDPSQYEGYYNRTQVGKNGVERVTAHVTYLNGVETSREIISTVKLSDPVDEKVTVGGKSVAEVGAQSTSSGFIWPTYGGYVSCHLNGYPGHTGMDIATDYGRPIFASASGIVTKVVWNRYGYGYHVIISHGGNVETLYAHCSDIYVSVGQWVEQGDTIAAVGRTGNASGNHVHFEIRSNGRYLNPANYVGTRSPY